MTGHEMGTFLPMARIDQLLEALKNEWRSRELFPPEGNLMYSLRGSKIGHLGVKWAIYDTRGSVVYRASVREFPSCPTLAITSNVSLNSRLRGHRIGTWMRLMRLRALTRCGFKGEIVTVRDDNTAQCRLMLRSGGIRIAQHPSDTDGTVGTWFTPIGEWPLEIPSPMGVESRDPIEKRMADAELQLSSWRQALHMEERR